MTRFKCRIGILAMLCLAALPALAVPVDPAKALGDIAQGTSNGGGVATQIGAHWNVPPYDCTQHTSGSLSPDNGFGDVIIFTADTGPCAGRKYTAQFSLSGGATTQAYGFTYEMACETSGPALTSRLAFCGTGFTPNCVCSVSTGTVCNPGLPNPGCPTGEKCGAPAASLVGIDAGVTNFPLLAGRSISVTTTQGVQSGGQTATVEAPALGTWTTIFVGLGMLLIGAFLIQRFA